MGKETERAKQLRSLHAKAESFVIAAPNGKYRFVKRLGRKLTFWYVQPFGEAQNQFNAETAEILSDLHAELSAVQEKLAALEAQTERRIAAVTQDCQQTVARMQSAHQAALASLTEEMNRSLCIAAPESRTQVGTAPLTALPMLGADAVLPELHAVQRAANPETMRAALDTLETRYAALLEDHLRSGTASQYDRCIALVCSRFACGEGMEAIRNEVWDLYRMLKSACRYPCCIVSAEPEGTELHTQGDIHYVPEDQLAAWMRGEDPALLIFCESTAAILNLGKQCMLLRNSIVRLSAQNPAQSLGGSRMQELLHLCDYGVQHYCTASKAAADTMESLGFRRPAVMYPYLDRSKPLFARRPRRFDAEHFTVGFASSPMQPEQTASRGIPALCETVRRNPDLHFIVLWRDETAVPVPDALIQAQNCEVRTGKCDMAAFYGEIDCVLIPYADENYNHACPLSALEGMLMGIPAVCTPVSGISELIAATGIGEIANGTDAAALGTALHTVQAQYAAYGDAWRLEKLEAMLSGKEFVRFVEYCAEHATPHGVCTLYEWDRQLKLENRHLVRGHAALKAYYQRKEVAVHYTADRFAAYPQSCFDLMERQSVSVLLRHLLKNTDDTARTLLDLACGDGRILQMLLPFGHCTAGDASPAMLACVKERFADAEALDVRQLDLLEGAPEGQYDVITIFRFIRHYEYSVRRSLWQRLRAALKDDGILLFDVPNLMFEVPHRQKAGWGKYHIYDVFWTADSIRRELEDNGLMLTALVPVGQGLYPMPAEYRDEPMTWTAAVRRKSEPEMKII